MPTALVRGPQGANTGGLTPSRPAPTLDTPSLPNLGETVSSGTTGAMQDLLSLAAVVALYLLVLFGLGFGVARWRVTNPHAAVAVGYARPLQRLAIVVTVVISFG